MPEKTGTTAATGTPITRCRTVSSRAIFRSQLAMMPTLISQPEEFHRRMQSSLNTMLSIPFVSVTIRIDASNERYRTPRCKSRYENLNSDRESRHMIGATFLPQETNSLGVEKRSLMSGSRRLHVRIGNNKKQHRS